VRRGFGPARESQIVRLLATAALTFALPATAAAEPRRSRPEDYGSKKICRVVPTTGSRLGQSRICRTRAEWADMKAQSRQVLDRLQSGGNPSCRVGACGDAP
jgi:hypothetical protein